VDIEIDGPNIDEACFDHPEPDHPASTGPAKDCVVDKIQEFADELANPDTDPEEQVVALKFLLHFVGDLHQPLHAADDHDTPYRHLCAKWWLSKVTNRGAIQDADYNNWS